MRFPYNPTKAAQATAYLASLYGEKEIALFKAVKLIYLANRMALIEIGRPITGDKLVNMELGGVPSQTYDALKIEDEDDSLRSPWSVYIEPVPGKPFKFRPKADSPDLLDLSEYELAVLKKAHGKIAYMQKQALVDYMHALEEYKQPSPGGTLPIDLADILRNASKSQEQIEEIETQAEEAYFLAALCRTA
ncbi:MAG TPA: Panacea domain-containing protein [Acidobacteriota bacterium]|nr:Panacea domain-containing protein [Acidobacteriota bacterium]